MLCNKRARAWGNLSMDIPSYMNYSPAWERETHSKWRWHSVSSIVVSPSVDTHPYFLPPKPRCVWHIACSSGESISQVKKLRVCELQILEGNRIFLCSLSHKYVNGPLPWKLGIFNYVCWGNLLTTAVSLQTALQSRLTRHLLKYASPFNPLSKKIARSATLLILSEISLLFHKCQYI